MINLQHLWRYICIHIHIHIHILIVISLKSPKFCSFESSSNVPRSKLHSHLGFAPGFGWSFYQSGNTKARTLAERIADTHIGDMICEQLPICSNADNKLMVCTAVTHLFAYTHLQTRLTSSTLHIVLYSRGHANPTLSEGDALLCLFHILCTIAALGRDHKS